MNRNFLMAAISATAFMGLSVLVGCSSSAGDWEIETASLKAPAPASAPAPEAPALAAPAGAAPADAVISESVSAESYEEWQATSLSAGEIDDNQRWDEYLEYRSEYEGPKVHDLDVSERYVVTVRGADGRPIPNSEVSVLTGDSELFSGQTYANGQTVFFPRMYEDGANAQNFEVRVEKGNLSESLEFARGETDEWVVDLDLDERFVESVPLDLLFLLDATGSMSDEIDQIKSTMLSISERINALPSEPDLRFGMVTYRDRGDDFVTRTYPFDTDVQKFVHSIRGVEADGGNDNPESLNEALHVAMNDLDWREGDAIRLVFLIADAPPHLDYEDDYDYAVEMRDAAGRGIKIFPIASSGLDVQGEYIFRQLALHTMGRFIFILYGGSTPHDVGQYSVENLDDLIVELVEEELAHLAG